jgi:hypothetical protein
MSARRQQKQQQQRTEGEFAFPDACENISPNRIVATPEIGIDRSYLIPEGISPAHDPNRALLRRVFFLNENKNRYVSIAFYPTMLYVPMVEFGGSKTAPIRLSEQQLGVLIEHLPHLCDALSANGHYTSGIRDDGFSIITTTFRAARMCLDRHTHITFKLQDLRYLNYIMPIIVGQLTRYTSAMTDVMTYALSAMSSIDYIEPLPSYSKNILYPQLFEELKALTLM